MKNGRKEDEKKIVFLPVRRLFPTNVMDNKNDSEPALKIDDATARVQFYVTDPRQYVRFFLSIPALVLIHHCYCYFSSSDFFFLTGSRRPDMTGRPSGLTDHVAPGHNIYVHVDVLQQTIIKIRN